jgi:sugar phosphate isomerase/epimerase
MQPTLAAYNFCAQDYPAFLRHTADAGFKHVGVGFFKGYLDLDLLTLTEDERRAFQQQLADHGLSLVAVFAGGANLLGEGGLEDVLQRLENAATLEVGIMDMGSFGYADKTPEQIATDEALFVERVRQVGDRAAQLGMTVCLETHGGFTGDTDSCLHAMAAIGHPNVKLAYDPANFWFYEGKDPADRLEQMVPFIGHTHLKDHRGAKGNADFPLVGEGQTDYDLILPTLWRGGYRGPYTLERAPGEDEPARAQALVTAYQRLTAWLPGD